MNTVLDATSENMTLETTTLPSNMTIVTTTLFNDTTTSLFNDTTTSLSDDTTTTLSHDTTTTTTLLPSAGSNTQLIIGLAVGISLGVLILIFIFSCLIYHFRKKQAAKRKAKAKQDAEIAKMKEKIRRHKLASVRSDGQLTIREFINRTKPLMLDVLWEVNEESDRENDEVMIYKRMSATDYNDNYSVSNKMEDKTDSTKRIGYSGLQPQPAVMPHAFRRKSIVSQYLK